MIKITNIRRVTLRVDQKVTPFEEEQIARIIEKHLLSRSIMADIRVSRGSNG